MQLRLCGSGLRTTVFSPKRDGFTTSSKFRELRDLQDVRTVLSVRERAEDEFQTLKELLDDVHAGFTAVLDLLGKQGVTVEELEREYERLRVVLGKAK